MRWLKWLPLLMIAALAIFLPPLGATAQSGDLAEKAASKCEDGFIDGETIRGNLVVDGTSCHVRHSMILGQVKVTDSKNFALIDSVVTGKVTITGGDDANAVILTDTTVTNAVVVKKVKGLVSLDAVWIAGSYNITIKNSSGARVLWTIVPDGNLKCTGIDEVLAAVNEVPNGVNTCTTDIDLD